MKIPDNCKYKIDRQYISHQQKWNLLKFEEKKSEEIEFKDPYYNYRKLGKPKISNNHSFDPQVIID